MPEQILKNITYYYTALILLQYCDIRMDIPWIQFYEGMYIWHVLSTCIV